MKITNCPVCDTKTDIQAQKCEDCGYVFGVEVKKTPIDKPTTKTKAK